MVDNFHGIWTVSTADFLGITENTSDENVVCWKIGEANKAFKIEIEHIHGHDTVICHSQIGAAGSYAGIISVRMEELSV